MEPDPRRIAGEARRCEGDVVLVTQVPAPPFAGQVDPFDETGDARNELPARARVDLPIRLDLEGVGSRSCEELVAPDDRTSVVSAKSVSVRVDLVGRRIIKKKK